MAARCQDVVNYPELHGYCNIGRPRSLAFPNVFITIAPAEWVFPLHRELFQRYKRPDGHVHPRDLIDVQALLTLHVSNVLQAVVPQLLATSSSQIQVVGDDSP